MKKFDIEYVESLRIHELRDLGKTLNISAPTKMKKEELVDKIKEVILRDNGMSPNMKHSVVNSEEHTIMELLISEDISLLEGFIEDDSCFTMEEVKTGDFSDYFSYDTIESEPNNKVVEEKDYELSGSGVNLNFSVAQNRAEYISSSDDNDVLGYIDFHPMGYGIIRANMGYFPTEDDVLVPKSLIDKYNIKSGELIKGRYKDFDNEPNVKVLCEIYSIDGKSEKTKSLSFENIEKNETFGPEYFLEKYNIKILRGEVVYLTNITLEETLDFSYDIVDQNLLNMKVFNVREKASNIRENAKRFDFINADYGTSESDILTSVELIAERIKREFENGISNVLIIYNFSEMIRQVNAAINGYYDFDKINVITLKKIMKILNIAKYSKNGIANTVICVDKSMCNDEVKRFFDKELNPRLDRIIDYNDYK